MLNSAFISKSYWFKMRIVSSALRDVDHHYRNIIDKQKSPNPLAWQRACLRHCSSCLTYCYISFPSDEHKNTTVHKLQLAIVLNSRSCRSYTTSGLNWPKLRSYILRMYRDKVSLTSRTQLTVGLARNWRLDLTWVDGWTPSQFANWPDVRIHLCLMPSRWGRHEHSCAAVNAVDVDVNDVYNYPLITGWASIIIWRRGWWLVVVVQNANGRDANIMCNMLRVCGACSPLYLVHL